MGVLQQTTKVLGVIPYAWGLGMAKEDGKDKATPPYTFFPLRNLEKLTILHQVIW